MVNEIELLFENQIQTWPFLARGIEGLKRAQTRAVRVDWFDVHIRHIPHRVASTTAAVDAESISKRPCFLCAGNLYPEQRGLAFNADYTIYCNPFPIVERHLTIVQRSHVIQRIEGEFGTMLDIAKAVPDYFVIYNGPECGASAPDHMHFQAGSRVLFPIERDLAGSRDVAIRNYARNVFLFRDSDRSRLVSTVYRAIDLLSQVTGKRPEPLINIAVFHDETVWTVYLFPRGKHRPSVYHTGELTVSPATIDLCGIFVAPFEKDFARISEKDVADIFREVTLPDNMFEEVAAKL
jgi:galactose-1-phosphate uridylyltransferase